MGVEEGDPETGRTAHGPEGAGEPCTPVTRVSKHAPGSMFCLAIIVLSGDSAGSPVFSGPLLFLQRTDVGYRTPGATRSGREPPATEASGPVGICRPEGDFLGPAQLPALLTSALDGCPELGGLLT